MANDPLAEANIQITANAAQAEAALKDAVKVAKEAAEEVEKEASALRKAVSKEIDSMATEAEDAAERAGKAFENAGRSAGKMGGDTQKSSGALRDLGQVASGAQSAISKLLIPVALFAGAKRLYDRWKQIRQEAEAFQKQIDNAGESLERIGRIQILAGLSEDEARTVDILKTAQDEAKALTDTLEKEILKRNSIFTKVIGIGKSGKDLGILSSDVEDAVEDIFKAATAKIEQENQKADARRREESRARFERQAQEAAEQQAELFARLADLDRSAANDLYLSGLSERDRIVAEARIEIEELRRQLFVDGADLQDSNTQRQLASIEASINAEASLRAKAFDERMAREEASEIEKNARVAKRAADDLEREMQRINDSLSGFLGGGGASGVVGALRDLTNAVRANR